MNAAPVRNHEKGVQRTVADTGGHDFWAHAERRRERCRAPRPRYTPMMNRSIFRAAAIASSHAAAPAGLLALLAGGAELSGSAVAAKLGITRAAVWKQIEQLRARGLPIRAEPGRGYRLEAPIELLDAARISAEIAPDLRARVGTIDVHWQIDSTSSELARHAEDSMLSRACLAEIQTQGRGRRGRAWQLPLAGGIALSFLRRFDGGMAELAGLSLVAGIAVLRAIEDCGIRDAMLKWPNDIVAKGRKLGGILVELGGDALGPCHAIIGVGVNMRMPPALGATIDQPWIDLATLAGNGAPPSRNRIAARILTHLAGALDDFATSGFAAFAHDYARYDALRDREITVKNGSDTYAAKAIGVTSRGALKVQRDGKELWIDSGEISVRDAGDGLWRS